MITNLVTEFFKDPGLDFLCLARLVVACVPTITQTISLGARNQVEVQMEHGLTARAAGVLEQVQAGGICRANDGCGQSRQLGGQRTKNIGGDVAYVLEMLFGDE